MFLSHEKMFVVYVSGCYRNNGLVIHGHYLYFTEQMLIKSNQINQIKTNPFGKLFIFLNELDFSVSSLKRCVPIKSFVFSFC